MDREEILDIIDEATAPDQMAFEDAEAFLVELIDDLRIRLESLREEQDED